MPQLFVKREMIFRLHRDMFEISWFSENNFLLLTHFVDIEDAGDAKTIDSIEKFFNLKFQEGYH